MGLLGAHAGEPPGAPSLPRLCWDRLLELLQAPLARREPEPQPDSPGKEPPSQPTGGAEATLVNGHSPAQQLQSPGPGSGPASTSTQWPNTQVSIGGADAPVPAGLEETPGSPVGGPSLPEGKVSPPHSMGLLPLASCVTLRLRTSPAPQPDPEGDTEGHEPNPMGVSLDSP